MGDIFFWVLISLVAVLLFFFWRQQQAVRILRQSLDEAQKNPAINMLQQELIAMRGQMQSALLGVTQQVNERLKENAEVFQQSQSAMGQRLDQIPKAVGDLRSSVGQVVGDLQNQIGQLTQASKQILGEIKEMESLKDILKPPKLRGGMGETLLENIIRQIFPSDDFYSFQHKFKDGEIVDAIIRFPKSGCVPIDAKFPLENFKKMTETQSEQEKKEAGREFIRNVKKHIDDISKKYIRPDEGTLNFALMYVPAENIYYEIVAREDGEDSLLSYAFKKRVFPVSPHTFYAFLFTLAQWVGVIHLEKHAQQVEARLARMGKDFELFSVDFEKVGAHLTNAQKQYVNAGNRVENIKTRLSTIQDGKNPELAEPETLKLETPPSLI